MSMSGYYRSSRLVPAFLACMAMIMSPVAVPYAQAQEDVIEEVVTIGTRVAAGRTASELPVPVDRLSNELLDSVGSPETARALQSLAPSFNFPSSTISDGSDALRPATLRGLGPDQVLVLVNGKRRHSSALVHINGSVGRGTAGVDFNAIPTSAIGRIEVLRDGAAAQYGSDAIAGVINIVLNDRTDGGQIGIYYGGYYPNDPSRAEVDYDSDGDTYNIWGNYGFEVGDLKVTFDINYRDRERTNRAGLLGSVPGFGNIEGPLPIYLPNADGSFDDREFTIDRNLFRTGDADSEHLAFTANASYELTDSIKLYSFVTWSDRDNTSGGFYRTPTQQNRNPTVRDGGTQAFYPDGFLPLINTTIEDIGFNVGVEFTLLNDWFADLSLTISENDFSFFVSDSVNASWVNSRSSYDEALTAQTSADSGSLSSGIFAINFDLSKPYEWGNLAVGAEYREDSFEITAGEEYSWRNYQRPLENGVEGVPADCGNGECLTPITAGAGIQVLSGFRPSNEVDETRDSYAVYADVEYTEIENFILGAALRYEDYSDFGETLNFKLTGRWQLTDALALRGAISTGFRAPSVQQQFFNNISTQFVGGEALEVGTFSNNSALARAIGIPTLTEEESVNYSLGLTYDFSDNFNVTLDLYQIEIDDRILLSSTLGFSSIACRSDSTGSDCNALDRALSANNANTGQFFINAADTETDGFDLVFNYKPEAFSDGGYFEYSLAFNYTNTNISSINVPSVLTASEISGNDLFGATDQSGIESWQPQDRANFNIKYNNGNWSGNLTFNHYGEYTTVDSGNRQTFSNKMLVDVNVRYQFEKTGLELVFGSNNLFGTTPDELDQNHGQSRAAPAGGLIDPVTGQVASNSEGVFVYSRRSAPFGFNGAFFYASLRYNF